MDNQKQIVTHAVTTPNKPQMSTLDLVRYNLNEKYLSQVTNFYNGDQRAAMRFMTGFVDYIRRVPRLIECTPISLVNSAMMIASFRFTPSSVAGEAYIIPYKNNGVLEAQFQPGYQGYVTLFYRAGVRAIQGEIVREHDDFTIENGIISHKVDPRKNKEQRGKAIGAYMRVVMPSGEPIYKYMNGEDILAHGRRFSKAFDKSDSPWKEANDPELHMWKKTVLLQMKATLPKNSELVRAMEEDFKDSTLNTDMVLDPSGPAAAPASHRPHGTIPAESNDVARQADVPDGKCPKGKHDRSRMSEDGIDCLACFDDANAEQPPAQQPDIKA